MMRISLLSLILTVTSSAFAVRHVGTGGGEAELKVLAMANSLPIWSQACNQNAQICWKQKVAVALPQLTAVTLQFIDEKLEGAQCVGSTLKISRADLYEADEKTPKVENELADVLVQSLANCREDLANVRGLKIDLIPTAKAIGLSGIFVMQSASTSVIAGANGSLHSDLISHTTCERYQVQNPQDFSFDIVCLDKPWRFVVGIQKTESGFQVLPRFDGYSF